MPNAMDRIMDETLEDQVPFSVLFELTNRCNADCVHCYVDRSGMENELTTEEVFRILAELRAAGTLFLTFSGGEVFIRRDILVLIRRARELGFALRLFSNGILIDEGAARVISEVGVIAVELSLYSLDPARHDAVTRVPGSQAQTIRAARLLRGQGITVCVKSPIMRGMTEEYRRLIAFADELGIEYRFDPTLTARNDLSTEPLAHRIESADFCEICKDPGLGLAVDPNRVRPPDPNEAVCASARRVALISAQGAVFPCSQRFPAAGSLRRQSFHEIWETAPLLLRLRNITVRDLPTCAGCSHFSFCGRCYLNAKFEDGDFWGISSWSGALAEARLKAFGAGGTTQEECQRARFGSRHPFSDISP